MPVDGFARIAAAAVAGVVECITTVYFPCADTVIPASRNAGFPLILTSRL